MITFKDNEYEVIDAHIHPFVDSENNIALYRHPATGAELVAEMKRCHIDLACGSVVRSAHITDFAEIRKFNDDALKFQAQYPDFYYPGISVNAGFAEESCREIERMHFEHKVNYIGELVCYVSDCEKYSDERFNPIYDLAVQLDLPVNIHQADIADLHLLMERFPKLKLVMAHPDDFGVYDARLELMKKYETVHLDLSGNGLYRWGMLRHGIDLVGKERFLFGSDFPICSCGMMLQGVLMEDLTDAELKAVLAGNFRRLYK